MRVHMGPWVGGCVTRAWVRTRPPANSNLAALRNLRAYAQLMQHLVGVEGYKASYRRIPLSRERTPEAVDVEQVHAQVCVCTGVRSWAGVLGGRRPTGAYAGHQPWQRGLHKQFGAAGM